ncbi:MAG: hypothetical protein ACK5N4_11400 [Parabacteroides gordonii]|uniref:hypothetical protein n=1 Tax=Parabacteroides gordonii TaxID=574930 RepID=UPI003A85A786
MVLFVSNRTVFSLLQSSFNLSAQIAVAACTDCCGYPCRLLRGAARVVVTICRVVATICADGGGYPSEKSCIISSLL